MELSWDDFLKVDMRVGTIKVVMDFPEARKPAYRIWINFGPEVGILKTSAQIIDRYSKDELLEKQVVAVVNFPKKQIANFLSECLILGAVGDKQGVVLLESGLPVPNGLRIG